jgi:hypothetical protein
MLKKLVEDNKLNVVQYDILVHLSTEELENLSNLVQNFSEDNSIRVLKDVVEKKEKEQKEQEEKEQKEQEEKKEKEQKEEKEAIMIKTVNFGLDCIAFGLENLLIKGDEEETLKEPLIFNQDQNLLERLKIFFILGNKREGLKFLQKYSNKSK